MSEHFGDYQYGHEPMPVAHPVRPPEEQPAPEPPDPYTPITPAEAAQLLKDPANRPVSRDMEPEETPPIPIEYRDVGTEGNGRLMDEKLTVSAEQAAADVARYREQIGQSIEEAERLQVQQATDALRGIEQQPTPEQQTQAPETPQPQPEAQPQDKQARIQKLLQDNPELLSELQTEITNRTQQADQARQVYENTAIESARVALAGIVASFPELANVRADQWGVVMQTLNRSNPERAAALSKHLEATSALLQNTNRVMVEQQQRAQQEYRTQWDRYALEEDTKFSEAAPDFQPAEREAAVNQLKDLGFTQRDIERLWNGEASINLRDHRAQLLLRDAVRFRQAQASLRRAAQHPIPPVQRPGSPQLLATPREATNRNLESRLNYSGNIKDAAALLSARRSGRR